MKLLGRRSVLGAMVLSTMLAMGSVSDASTLTVNGNNITGSSSTYSESGVTMVPLRVIGEGLGLDVNFEKATGQITMKSEHTTVIMTAGRNQAKVNNETVVMTRPSIIKNGTTYVPLRFIGEAMGATIAYDEKTKAIVVTSNTGGSTVPTTKPAPVPQQDKKDVYGRAIRTTNLPKNAAWFPYIVEGIPNWAYEQQPFDDNYWGPSISIDAPKGASKVSMLPIHVHNSPDAISRVLPDVYEEMKVFMEAYLNVDYRTIDKQHYADTLTNLTDLRTTSLKSEKELHELFESFADYIKDKKIVIESTFEIMPETTWVTIGDPVGVMNFSVYTKMKTVSKAGNIFNMPGTVQILKTKSKLYPEGVKKSTVKEGQELEGIFTVTMLRVGMGEWKIHHSSMQPLMTLNPLRDTMNGVAPSKKSKDRAETHSYTWCRDDTVLYTRYDKNTKSTKPIN